MSFRNFLSWVVLAATQLVCLSVATAASHNKIAVKVGTSEKFSVKAATQIPGKTLEPGPYSIHIVDRLSDRIIVQVQQKGGAPTTFLALPNKSEEIGAGRGPILLNAKTNGNSALKGFAFADGTVAEFVYPKAEAVALAKANGIKVIAIDPASEGRVAEPALSAEDMKMVTLWMLTPTPVGPDDQGPGIKAARYQQVAGVQAPRPPRPMMAALPHTASMMPTLWLIAVATAFGAGLLMWWRVATVA